MIQILFIIAGIISIGAGIKAFSPSGITLSGSKQLKGKDAKLVGIIMTSLGAVIIVFALFILPAIF